MFLGSFCLLLPPYDHHHLLVIVTGLLREQNASTKLVTHTTNVGTVTADQEAMVLGLATDLKGVVFLGLVGGGIAEC